MFASLEEKSVVPAPEISFVDVTSPSGLDFQQSYGDRHLNNIVESSGTGVCVFDYNNDGFLDIYFPNGKWTEGLSDPAEKDLQRKLTNHLFRNNGNGTFTDVTEQAGLAGSRYSAGCAAGDYDNDGNVDLLVLKYGRNELFHNDGRGKFTEVGLKAGLTDARFSLSAVWFDYNNDGYLDLFIGNYVKYDESKDAGFDPSAGYPGPLTYDGQSNLLYRNNGDGTFSDVTKAMGLWKADGRSMSVTAADFKNDGRLELLSTNDAMENYYFVIANLRDCSLLIQRPDGQGFDYKTNGSGLVQNRGQYPGWAAMLFDFDHDGWLNLFNANGSAQHEYPQENTLFRNRGNGKFENVSAGAGPHFQQKHVPRGGAGFDYYNNDGKMDLVIVNLNDRAILFKNETRNPNHWITVTPRLAFPTGTRDAYGARVVVEANGMRMVEV